MRELLRLPFLLIVLFGMVLIRSPEPATAQELGTECNLQSYRVLSSQVTIQGRRVTWVGRPDLVCPNGTRIQADSAVIYEESGRNELIGRVRFDDPQRELRSDLADYYEPEGRLLARGSVEFRDLIQGTEIRGDTLVFLEAGGQRAEDHVTVQGQRPSVTFFPVDAPEEDEDGVELEQIPYQVTANRLRFEGERHFWADGDAEMQRDELRASADSLWFHREDGDLALTGEAELETDEAEFTGGQILVEIPGDEIRSITVRDRGRLLTQDIELLGEEIRIRFVDERIQRLVAVHREPSGEGEGNGRPQPRAITEDFLLIADSIDVVSPDEQLETVHAVGRARAETGTREEREGAAESADSENMIPERDWIEGDEILAAFQPVVPGDPDVQTSDLPESESDSRREYRLDRLVATGSARTLYRSPPDDRGGTPGEPTATDRESWSVSYLLADEIAIHLLGSAVDRVEAEGNVRGIQLEPSGPRTSSVGAAEEEDLEE